MPLHVPAGDIRTPIYLLTVTFEGESFRFASAAVSVTVGTDPDASVYDFRGGLTIEAVEEVLDSTEPVQAICTAPLVIAWSAGLLARLSVGSFARARGEIAVIADGDAWEDRRVLLTGILSEPEEDRDSVVSATLTQEEGDDAGLYPAADAVVRDEVTWTYPDEASEGAVYPLVFGAPGLYSDEDGASQTCPGSPMPQVYQQAGADELMVAGHKVFAASVTAYEGSTTSVPTVTASADLLGRKVSIATFPAPTGATSGASYWAAWDSGEAHTPSLAGAGALLRHVLSYSRVAIDWARLEVAIPSLDRWLVDGFIDERVSPLQWVVDNLLPLLPVTLANGPKGIYPVVWNWDVTADDAVVDLVEGRNFSRIGPRAWEGADEVYSQIELGYALDASAKTYRRTLIATGDPALVGNRSVYSSEVLRRAWSRWPGRILKLESDIVYRDATAGLWAAWLSRRHSGLRAVISGDVPRRLWHIRKGDPVTFTSTSLEVSESVGWVRRLIWSGPSLTAEIVLR